MRLWFFAFLWLLLMAWSCSQHKHEHEEAAVFEATRVEQKDTLLYREYVCQIRAIQHIELRALEKGYLQRIHVDEGKHVRKGQLMFEILPIVYQAEVERARAELTFAEVEYQNTKLLADSGVVSKNELALARARLEKARAELSLAQAHLQFTSIRAPFDGIMDRLHVRVGSLLDEGELLTELSDNSKMWVYFNVPETEYLDFALQGKLNETIHVKLMMANRRFYPYEGVIETIQADFNPEMGTIAFRATFPNPEGILRHGETGNIYLPVFLDNALLIPQKATFEVLEKKFVYVIDAHGKLQSREIRVAAELPHLYVIGAGLKAGEQILTDGLRKVKNGERIRYHIVPLQEIVADMQQLYAE